MRRSFAGLLFGITFACACVAISGYLLQRTAFSPQNTADAATVVLADDDLRAELVRVIVASTANQMYPNDPAAAAIVADRAAAVADTAPGAELMAGILHDAHAVLIGQQDGPVQISSQQLVQVVRDERAAVLPPVALDVPRIGMLASVNSVLDWLVPLSALAAVAFFVLTLLAHPERPALFRTLGIGLVVLAAMTLIFAYVVPRFVPTLLDDSVWARMPARLADDALPLTVGLALVLAGAGAVFLLVSARIGRSRRWSTPVSTYRYREERRWS